MRVLQNGIANNFGLVGKSIRRYLGTTALTATGLMALATPALADNWTDHTATEGSISIDTAVPNTTNITQHTNFVKVQGDGDINAGWTVNVAQPSSGSKYVLYDTENDPTKIMGALNANGQIYIFDKNGVIFGKDSQVNVGSIIASTGTISDANLNANKLVFENVGGPDAGEIVNEGTITVAESGLAAFVAPTVVNSGVINAHAATVVLASGEKVAIDLYGDNLVSIAADGALEEALIENKGAINANGGKVAISAQAAKGAVDNVINMDGVIDVSSVTTKGGKIILGGGNKGVVKVAGKLKADGATGGGSVKVTGQNVDVQQTADISVNATSGDAGDVLVYGRDYAIFSGRISGRGGKGGNAEVSAGESVGYYGMTDLGGGTLLIDPKNLTINNNATSGVLADLLSGGTANVNINAQALADTLATTNVNLWASETLSTAAAGIDLSTWSAFFGLVKGITTHDLNLAAPTVNINGDIILGTGKLTVNDHLAGVSPLGLGLIPAPTDIIVNTLNLNGLIKTRSVVSGATTLAADAQINSTANTINVKSPNAKIQQAISFAEGNGETINVANGTYNESVNVNKTVTLKGANAGKRGADFITRGTESIINPNSPGFHVTANNVSVDGFYITGATGIDGYGVLVDGGADNTTISNNIIDGVSQQGIHANGVTRLTISRNRIDNTGSDGIYVDTTDSNTHIKDNTIGLFMNVLGNGIYLKNLTKGDATGNLINSAGLNGIKLENTRFLVGSTLSTDGNIIQGSGLNGIEVSGGNINHIYYNTISYAGANGIYVHNNSKNLVAIGNDITGMSNGSTVLVENSDGVDIVNNKLHNSLSGVYFANVSGLNNDIYGNTIQAINNEGVYLLNSANATISNNVVINTGSDAIALYNSGFATITNNLIGYFAPNMSAGADNIFGDGILLVNSDGDATKSVKIQGNKITETHNVVSNKGSGVQLINSDYVLVGSDGNGVNDAAEGNEISKAYWDGIRSVATSSGTNTVIRGNKITDINQVGVFTSRVSNVTIDKNNISSTGDFVITHHPLEPHGAITSYRGSNVIVTNNVIDDVTGHGIYLNDVGGTNNRVHKNTITKVTKDGIQIKDMEFATVRSNKIRDAGANGIHSLNSDNVTIGGHPLISEGNDILRVGANGIKIDGGDTNHAYNNKIDSAGENGIYAVNSNELLAYANIVRNISNGAGILVKDSTAANTTANWVYASKQGIYYSNVTGYNNDIYGNRVQNIVENGVDVSDVSHVDITKNRISDIGGDSIHGNGFDSLLADLNDIWNSGEDGIHTENGGTVEIVENKVFHSGKDGILVNNVGNLISTLAFVAPDTSDSIVKITGNTVDTSADDGIEVLESGKTLVQDNDIYYSGYILGKVIDEEGPIEESARVVYAAETGVNRVPVKGDHDGIHVDGVYSGYEYAVNVIDNDVSYSMDDGIEVENGGRTLVYNNRVDHSGITDTEEAVGYSTLYNGADGITVHNIYADGYAVGAVADDEFQGYAIDIIDNVVDGSVDDGISVHDASSTYIAGNTVSDSGFNFVDTDLEDGDDSFSTGDVIWGADGIHVRNVWNNTKYVDDSYDRVSALVEGEGEIYFRPYSVVIRGNTVTNSNDDGIQVAFSGDTLIGGDTPAEGGGFVGGNTVTNSGTATGARQFGGDGINVVTGYYSLSALLSGKYRGMEEVSVEVLGNTVGNSLDDGIEVVGANTVEVGFNGVTNSGDDGINVLGFAGFYTGEEPTEELPPFEEGTAGKIALLEVGPFYWPYFSANIHDNNVVDSGNDGIESRGFNDLEVSRNIVTNSGANGLYVSGFNNGYSYINGNTFAGFDIGGHFESGMIDLVNGASNSFTNGRVGLRFAPFAFGDGEGEGEIEVLATLPTSIYDQLFPYPFMLPSSGYAPLDLVDDDAGPNSPSWPVEPPSNFGGSIGAQIFEDISQYYVELDNEAFFAPGTPTWLNGLNSSYDGTIPGLTGGLLSEEEFNRIEGKFWHHPDGLLADQNLGRFWFGFFIPETAAIDQKDLFNIFDPFNGDLTGLNVRITGLPSTGFGPAPAPQNFAAGLNNIQTFAGGPGTNPSDLNNIETAAGGDTSNNQQPQDLNNIDPAAGGDNTNCWSDAIDTAAGGQSVNVVYGGSINDNLNQAASCGTSF